MKCTFIGLGRMGAPMAKRILKNGRELTVFNRNPAKTAPLIGAGAKAAKSLEAAIKGAELLITMVSDDAALESVASPELLGATAEGAVHVSMSTISVELAESLTFLHASLGRTFLSCPVFGRPEAAAEGQLRLCLAGPSEAKALARPYLEPMGPIRDLGERPAGANAVKLAGNFMIGATIEMLAEAFSLVESHGADPEAFFELVSGTNFSSPVVKTYGRLLLDGKFEPAGFSSLMASKDADLIRAAARQCWTPMPMASLVEDRLLRVLARGWEDLDWSVIGYLQREDTGLVKSEENGPDKA